MKRYPELSDFLVDKYLIFVNKRRGNASVADFARICGVSATNMGRYMDGSQSPTSDNLYSMAEVLGPELYDAVKVPRMMPKDTKLSRIAEVWHLFTDDERNNFVDEAEVKAERHKTAEGELRKKINNASA